ncbi:glycosyltransferase family A protein [Shewanella indica]|uniref:glycosyltransferase family 2 protein n=1 Tax=Shewanella indica TaxID=768528 RepID=UPI003004FC8C
MINISISTMDRNFGNTLEVVSLLSRKNKKINFLIICQKSSSNVDYNLSNNLRIIKTTSVGLSKSRNLAIESVNTGWIWFQDDDIKLDESKLEKIIDELYCYKPDLYFIKIGSLENKNEYYKNYSFFEKHSYLNFLKVSSIEIVANIEFIKNNNLKFNESLGLGTTLPCCEENKFIYDCFLRTRNVKYSDIKACYHTTLIENRNIDIRRNLIAKGYFLRIIPFYIALPLLFRWSFKFSKKSELKPFSCLRYLIQGYRYNI